MLSQTVSNKFYKMFTWDELRNGDGKEWGMWNWKNPFWKAIWIKNQSSNDVIVYLIESFFFFF